MANDIENVESVKRELGTWDGGEGGKRNDLADFKTACSPATVEGGWPAPVVRATVESEKVSSGSLSCFVFALDVGSSERRNWHPKSKSKSKSGSPRRRNELYFPRLKLSFRPRDL